MILLIAYNHISMGLSFCSSGPKILRRKIIWKIMIKISSLLGKSSIMHVPHKLFFQFYLTLQLVLKDASKILLNLLEIYHHKIEVYASAIQILSENCIMASVDQNLLSSNKIKGRRKRSRISTTLLAMFLTRVTSTN